MLAQESHSIASPHPHLRMLPGSARQRSAGGERTGAFGLIGIDQEGHIDSVGGAAESMLGWRRDDLVGKPVIALTGVQTGEALAHANAMLRALRGGRQLRLMQTHFRRRGGDSAVVTCTATPRADGSGLMLAFRPWQVDATSCEDVAAAS